MAGQSDRRYEELSASGEGASGYKYLPLPLTRTSKLSLIQNLRPEGVLERWSKVIQKSRFQEVRASVYTATRKLTALTSGSGLGPAVDQKRKARRSL